MHKSAIWDRISPHLHIKCSLYVCSRVQGSQIFKQNSIILICSKVIAFLVILWSPHGPHHPHIVAVVPMSSPHHPHCPQKVPMWSPHPHGCGLHGLHPTWSPHPHGPHVIPVIPTSSLLSPHCPNII